jgi:hypothetical protein
MEGNDAIDITGELHELVCGFVDIGAEFQFALVIEEVDAVHLAEAFSAAVAAVVSYLKVFFSAALASASF